MFSPPILAADLLTCNNRSRTVVLVFGSSRPQQTNFMCLKIVYSVRCRLLISVFSIVLYNGIYFTLASPALECSKVDVSGSYLATLHVSVHRCSQTTSCLKIPLLSKSYIRPSRGGGFGFIKRQRPVWISGTFQRLDWSSVINPGKKS